MTRIRLSVLALAAGLLCFLAGSVPAQQADKANPDYFKPSGHKTVGKVTAYEPDKSITVEMTAKDSKVTKRVFTIVKDKTKIELPADVKALAVGMMVIVNPEKDNNKLAAKISVQETK